MISKKTTSSLKENPPSVEQKQGSTLKRKINPLVPTLEVDLHRSVAENYASNVKTNYRRAAKLFKADNKQFRKEKSTSEQLKNTSSKALKV